MIPFTVVTAPHVVGAFRPGHASGSKASWVKLSDIDMSKLPNLAADILSIPDFASALAQIRFMSWQHTYNANSRNVLSTEGGAPVYGGDRDRFVFSILALCYDGWTASQKTQIARAFVRMAIDITARVEQGGIFQENGGHCTGQKTIVALAAHLTGHSRFLAALNGTTTLFTWQGGTHSVWGEDRQIFRVAQADVNRRQKYEYNYPASMIGTAEWSSDATRDNPDGASNFRERLNTLGVTTSGAAEDLKQSYRHIVAAVSVPAALALRFMGAHIYMGSTWPDYYDRHMAARVTRGNSPTPATTTSTRSRWPPGSATAPAPGPAVGGPAGAAPRPTPIPSSRRP